MAIRSASTTRSAARLAASCLLLSLVLTSAASAQDRDLSRVEVTSTPLRGGTYLLMGAGGNIVASVGDDGTFIVDDQFAPLTDKIRDALARIDDKPVRFVINTHWHGDHTGGNQHFGEAGAVIVAQDNVRKRMTAEQLKSAVGDGADKTNSASLPVVTFDQAVTLHLNGNDVRVVHVANAHTDGDALVKFEQANVLHMGDTFFNSGYPFIDTGSGGTIDGVLAALQSGLSMTDADTIVVPGHGERSDATGMTAYRDLLKGYRDRIAGLKADGRTLAEVIAAKPTAATDARLGGGFIKPAQFIEAIYTTL